MNKKAKNGILLALLACALAGGETAFADQVYELNPVTVTAQRSQSSDLKTPSAVDVLTHSDIQKTGATSVQEALKFTTGIIAHAQGPRNISQGTMTNKVVIRGVEKGTLVLVDGVPINQAGRYNLEDIPVESIEKIEVVRGGGAVLYGSEANGGVINIITKGERPNLVRAGFGNYGIQNYALSAQAGKLGFTATYDHTGKIDHVSSPEGGRPQGMYFNIRRGEHANFNARYDFNDKLFISHSYGRNSDHYLYRWDGRPYSSTNSKTHKTIVYPAANAGAPYKNELHSTEENLTTLHYDDGNLKAEIFYNRRDQKSNNNNAGTYPYMGKKYNYNEKYYDSSSYLDETMGIDVSNRWHFSKGSFMLGYDFQREMEDATVSDKMAMGKLTKGTFHHYTRNMHSFYGQLAYDFTEATRANLNFRETWTEADAAGNKYDKFTPEFILMHDLDKNTMIYGKVGKSFMMPTFTQLYGGGNIRGAADLKPSSGTHYELGWKKNVGKNAWRAALYHYKIDDSQEAKWITEKDGTYSIHHANENIRNTGIELEWTRNQSDNLSWHAGLTYSHPEKQEKKVSTAGKETSIGWHDYYGKIGGNLGINYISGKLTTAFNISYLGRRIRDTDPYPSMKSQWLSDLNFSYKANESSRFFLNIDNLFNRRDIISTSSSTFYDLGRNFMFGYEYKF